MEIANQKPRVPAWRIGVAVAIALWLLAFTLFFAEQRGWLPRSITRLPFVRTFTGYCGFVAFPVPLLGWIYVWGDMGPPFVEYPIFNILFGIFFYGLLGALIGYIANLTRKRQFSLREMMIVFTLTAILLGVVA